MKFNTKGISLLQSSLLIITVITTISSQQQLSEQAQKEVKLLACAAISRKFLELRSFNLEFQDTIMKFSQQLKQERDNTKNFVHLLHMQNCFKDIPFELAASIIKDKADKKDLHESHLKYLNYENCYDDYVSMTPEKRTELFDRMKYIKDQLSAMSNSFKGNANSGRQADSGKARNAPEADRQENQDVHSAWEFFSRVFQQMSPFVQENIFFLSGVVITLLLVFAISLCKSGSKKKVKSKSKSN